MINDRHSGDCKGFGFVYFDRTEDAVRAKRVLTSSVTKMHGRVLRIDFSLTDHSGGGSFGKRFERRSRSYSR